MLSDGPTDGEHEPHSAERLEIPDVQAEGNLVHKIRDVVVAIHGAVDDRFSMDWKDYSEGVTRENPFANEGS